MVPAETVEFGKTVSVTVGLAAYSEAERPALSKQKAKTLLNMCSDPFRELTFVSVHEGRASHQVPSVPWSQIPRFSTPRTFRVLRERDRWHVAGCRQCRELRERCLGVNRSVGAWGLRVARGQIRADQECLGRLSGYGNEWCRLPKSCTRMKFVILVLTGVA